MSVRGTRIPPHLQLPIAGVTPPPTEKEGQRLFPTGNFRFYRPVYRDKMPPCNNACPTGEQIQKYLDYVKHDRYLDGYVTILEDNPMPSVTGRVCYHPCEKACNRAEHDEPIGIRCGVRAGRDIGWDELRSYPAAFLALGQDVGRRLPVEGIEARGVIGALEFLREAGLGRPVKIGRQVLVIGGGNTASDAARSAIRLGGGEAIIASLESAGELLIVPEDLEQARDEGVAFAPNTSLVKVLSADGQVTGAVVCDA